MPAPLPSPDSAPVPPDVRMRGFASRATVHDALNWVDTHSQPHDVEAVALDEAPRRVLAEDVISQVAVPGFDRAMMDGFALRAEETDGASTYNPLELQIVGDVLPGSVNLPTIAPGQAARVMTGAPVPPGANAVLPVERTEVDGDRLWVFGPIPVSKHVGPQGEDIRPGDRALPAGRRLRPQDLGILSSIGLATVAVYRRPRVRIVITGNELLPSGSQPRGTQIVDANGPMLQALVERDGGTVNSRQIVPDHEEAVCRAMHDDVDVVLVSGGSSVGIEDFAPRLLAQHGQLAFHGIAMRPSSPTGMGRLQHRLVFLLPGNPVSCLCAYDFFAGRAIRRCGGLPTSWPYRSMRLPLRRKLVSQIGRVDYARVSLRDGHVDPLAISGASILSSTSRADGFVVIAEQSEGYAPGSEVEVFLYDA